MDDARRKPAEEHELVARTHRTAAKHNGKGDTVARSRQSERAEAHQIIRFPVIANLAGLPVLAKAQGLPVLGDSPGTVTSTIPAQPDLPYTRPSQATKLRNYAFDAFGTYPIVGAALTAGISQVSKGIPDWGQGAEGYGKRIGSDFGIAAVSTTTRYALSEAFQQDALGGDIALEFLYSGPHSWLHRMHLNNGHGTPNPGLNR